MKNKMKTLLGVLLALTMAVGLLPGMLSTAHADGYCPYCGSTSLYYSEPFYMCDDCGEVFESPSATPPTPPVHHHAWDYFWFENTIEAKCYSTDDCPDGYSTDGILLSIAPPSSLVCDGNPKAATISGSIPDELASELATPSGITYSSGNSNLGSNAPNEPGTYTASFSWGGVTASVSFTLTGSTPAHTHSWSYQADGSTVTATCTGTGDCDYKTNGIALTINAPSNLVCDGSAKAATRSGYPASAPEGLAARPSITYNPGGSTAPTTAGDYTASFTWGGATASVSFTLTQPNLTVQYLCPNNHPVRFVSGDTYFCDVCVEPYDLIELHTAQQTHTHSWSYQANGSTVTATCTGDGACDYKTNGIALTIAPPSDLVCDGNEKVATISGYPASAPEGLAALPSISYNPGGSTAPSTAGTYTASSNWGGETAFVTFTLTNPHTHSWGYQATGATVTASCGQGCDITTGLSITISAPSGTLTYDGNGKAATLSTGYNTTAFPGSYSISYTKNGSPVSGTPTEAGTYTASFTVGTATGSVNYTINKADPIANAPTGLTATYGQTLANVTLSNPHGNTAGTWAWADSAATVGNAGKNAIQANFTPDDAANYNTASADVTVTVQRKDVIVTANSKSKTEGEADPALTATVDGAVGKDRIDYNLSRDQGDQAGEYTIHVIAGNNPNYSVSAVNGTFTIRSLAQAAGDAVVVEKGVASIPEESIGAILATENEGTVSLDMSVRGEEVTEIVLPAALLDKVAEAGDALAITLTEGTLALDAETVAAMKELANGQAMSLMLDPVPVEELNEAEQEAIKDLQVLAIYDVYMTLNGERVENLTIGKVTAAVKTELAEGQSEANLQVLTLSLGGKTDEVISAYEEGKETFEVSAFGKYVIICAE